MGDIHDGVVMIELFGTALETDIVAQVQAVDGLEEMPADSGI